MAFTVTASQSSVAFSIGLKVQVVTGATEAGGASTGTATSPPNASLTPNFTNSLIVEGLCNESNSTAFTASASNTLTNTATEGSTEMATGNYTGTVTAGPTLAFSDFKTTATSGTLTSASFTPQAGDIIVVKISTEGVSGASYNTPTGGGWTYTSRVNDTTAGFCSSQIWTAPVTAGGTAQTVASTPSGAPLHASMVVELWRGGQLAATPATCDARGTGSAPSTTLTTVAAGSVVSWSNADFAANDPTGHTYRTTSGTPTEEGMDNQSPSFYVGYYAWQRAAAAGAQTLGLTAPATQTWTLAGIEIQAASVTVGASAPTAQNTALAAYELPPLAGVTPVIDGSSPAFVHGAASPQTTASFTPPNGSVLVAIALGTPSSSVAPTISDTSGLGLIWTQRAFFWNSGAASAAIFTATMPGGSVAVAQARQHAGRRKGRRHGAQRQQAQAAFGVPDLPVSVLPVVLTTPTTAVQDGANW